MSGGSEGRTGDLRHFVPILMPKGLDPRTGDCYDFEAKSEVEWSSLEMSWLPLPVPGTRLCYFSTEDSAQRALLETELGPLPVAVYTGEF